MSESTFPLKKVIPIIVVTWILSLVTTLAVVYFAPNIFRTWYEMERFEGNDTDDYWNTFDVPSMHWRIRCGVFGLPIGSRDSRFHLTVDDFTLRELTWEYVGYGYSGENYFTGSGLHYIEVYADNVEWVIIVEAYY